MCCLQEVRWRGWDAGDERKWYGKDEVGGVGVMVKELCQKVVEVRRESDRMMTVVVVFEEDVLRLICWYAL